MKKTVEELYNEDRESNELWKKMKILEEEKQELQNRLKEMKL